MFWPGLTGPPVRHEQLRTIEELPENKEREERILSFRNQQKITRQIKISSLERGWSGTKAPGRSLGPPDVATELGVDGFTSVVLSLGLVSHMTVLYRSLLRRLT